MGLSSCLLLLTAADCIRHVTVHNHATNALIRDLDVSHLPIRAVRFVPRKSWILAGADDYHLRVYNLHTGQRLAAFEAHTDYIRAIAVHPSLPYVITGADDMSIKMWDWDQGWKCIRVRPFILSLSFHALFLTAPVDLRRTHALYHEPGV